MEPPLRNGLPLPAPVFSSNTTFPGGTQATSSSQPPTEPAFYAQQTPQVASLQPPVSDAATSSPQPACQQQSHQPQSQAHSLSQPLQPHRSPHSSHHHPPQPYRSAHNHGHLPSPFSASCPPPNSQGSWPSPERDFENYSYHQAGPATTTGPVASTYHSSLTSPRSWAAPTSQGPYHAHEDPVQPAQQQLETLRLSIPSTSMYGQHQQPVVRTNCLPVPEYAFEVKRRRDSLSPSHNADPNSAAISPPSVGVSLPSMSITRSNFVASPEEESYFSQTGTSDPDTRANTPDSPKMKPKGEPYARLILKAFMSRPDRRMTLQEIYQWFKENTDKANGPGKGWQNSIRHNLSMNGVSEPSRVFSRFPLSLFFFPQPQGALLTWVAGIHEATLRGAQGRSQQQVWSGQHGMVSGRLCAGERSPEHDEIP
jgi:hypothetical protein